MVNKQKIFDEYLQLVSSLVTSYESTLKDLAESAANETKSTAGDKHETALAMLQIEQRNIKARLEEAREKKKLLEMINIGAGSIAVQKGSLIKTNHGYFYLTVALGKILIDGVSIMAISPQSPLGSKMLGLKVDESLQVSQTTYVIYGIE